jgi:hypothetical protein
MDQEEKRAYNQQYFREHRSDIYARRQQRVAKRRASLHQFFDELKQGQACQRCGIADPRLLEFRYQDERGKTGNLKNKAITMNWSIQRILQEVEKSQLLCWNCRKLQAEREK